MIYTARQMGELSSSDLKHLAGHVTHKERIARWVKGVWVPRPHVVKPRGCLYCGRDLPAGARADTLRHEHCRSAAQRRRRAEGVLPRTDTATVLSDPAVPLREVGVSPVREMNP